MTGRLYLFGHPVGHSLSPAMHRAAARLLGLDLSYEALDVRPDELPGAVARLRRPDGLGANVTVPHKEAIVPLLDDLEPTAAAIGAVNTVARRGERLVGHNTDAPGFLAALGEAGVEPTGRRVLVLGAGGAARAVLFALAEQRPARLAIANRSQVRAERLAADLAERAGPIAALPLDPAALDPWLAECDLLINATSVGLRPEESPLPGARLPAGLTVVDLIYNPSRTRLLREAEAAGARTVNGLGMLVHQAALAFALWTGATPPVEAMRAAALGALAARPASRPEVGAS